MKIVSATPIGRVRTFDIEVAHPDHQFLVDAGRSHVVTSNSHAVSYALDSYMCAYLLTYHEAEWLCAYAELYSGDPKSRAKMLSEIAHIGYTIKQIDVNIATTRWQILEGKRLVPSLTTCKGLGKVAEQLAANRPYTSFEDFLWGPDGKVRYNKTVVGNLMKIGAFESLGCVGPGRQFDNYRHMYLAVIENWADIRKRDGRERLHDLIEASRGVEDWTKRELIESHLDIVGFVNPDILIEPQLRRKLSSRGVVDIDALVEASVGSEGNEGYCWFTVLSKNFKKSRKGKTYAVLEVMGTGGQRHRMFVWGARDDDPRIVEFSTYVALVEVSGFGTSTAVWKMRTLE